MAGPHGLILALFGIAFLLLFLSSYAVSQRRIRAAGEFAALMATMVIYALGYSFELSFSDLAGMMAVIRFEYLGIAVLPAFWVLFTFRFARIARPRSFVTACLFLIPLIVLAAVWTNDLHHLFYSRMWLRLDGPFPVFGFERGPIYWLNIAYTQAAGVVGNTVLIIHALRSPLFLRRQSLMAVCGSFIPWIGNVAYLLGFVPHGLDPTVFFFAISAACFSLAIFRLGFFQIVPVARDRAIESLHDGFLVFDSKGHVIDSNQAARALLGDWTSREGYAIPPEKPGGAEIARIVAGIEDSAEFSVPGTEGSDTRLSAQSFPVRVGRFSNDCKAIVVRDVTETAALLVRLAELAGTDELTGLSNRRRFFEYAHREFSIAIRERHPIAVAMLDIDHFKDVNDRFGHAAGDLALREFSSRLSRGLREADILCRYGGEEFAIVLPLLDAEPALATVERVRLASTSEAILGGGEKVEIRASAGVYSGIPREDYRVDEFLGEADRALYEAKVGGRDRTVLRS